MDNAIKIVRMTPSDIDIVYAMNLEVFETDTWQIEWFEEGLNDPDGYYYFPYFNN